VELLDDPAAALPEVLALAEEDGGLVVAGLVTAVLLPLPVTLALELELPLVLLPELPLDLQLSLLNLELELPLEQGRHLLLEFLLLHRELLLLPLVFVHVPN